MNDSELKACVAAVVDPELERPLGELGMLKQAANVGGTPRVGIELPTPAYPDQDRFQGLVDAAIREQFGDTPSAQLDITWKVQGKESGGKIGLRVKNVIAVGSGKGGVGKSTTAAMLAYGLHSFGAKVGLLDADVYGPSIPHLCGAGGEPGITEHRGEDGNVMQRIQPIEKDGLKLLSVGFMVKADQAVVWRGPMLHRLLTQFMQQTDWGELDYLLIVMPPGTGDVQMALARLLPQAEMLVLTTPALSAQKVAVRVADMATRSHMPVLGVIENMSAFVTPDGKSWAVFGEGGGQRLADEIGVPLLGSIPLETAVSTGGDSGRPVALDSGPASEAFREIASLIVNEISPPIDMEQCSASSMAEVPVTLRNN